MKWLSFSSRGYPERLPVKLNTFKWTEALQMSNTLHGVNLREKGCNPMKILSVIVTSKAAILT